MWETVFNIFKVLGYLGGCVALLLVIARVWNGTARERLISNLEKELALAQKHNEQGDKDVRHYRDEMHEVRKKCEGEVKTAQADLEDVKDRLKSVELENASLRARPDLSTLAELIEGSRISTESIREALTSHSEADAKIFASIDRSLSALPETLKSMSKDFDKRQRALLKRLRR